MLEIFVGEDLVRMSDQPDVVKAFLSEVKVIEAAGGVVRNERNDVLWIYRMGRWDLPKGKVRKWESGKVGESLGFEDLRISRSLHLKAEAAREVKEETGLVDVAVEDLIDTTFHCYLEPKRYLKPGKEARIVLKVTWWFGMRASGDQRLVPQLEEEITEARWIPVNEMEEMLADTYGNVRRLIQDTKQ